MYLSQDLDVFELLVKVGSKWETRVNCTETDHFGGRQGVWWFSGKTYCYGVLDRIDLLSGDCANEGFYFRLKDAVFENCTETNCFEEQLNGPFWQLKCNLVFLGMGKKRIFESIIASDYFRKLDQILRSSEVGPKPNVSDNCTKTNRLAGIQTKRTVLQNWSLRNYFRERELNITFSATGNKRIVFEN